MKNKIMKSIELYVGYSDWQWSIITVDIPVNTPKKDILKVATTILADEEEFIFTGIYSPNLKKN